MLNEWAASGCGYGICIRRGFWRLDSIVILVEIGIFVMGSTKSILK